MYDKRSTTALNSVLVFLFAGTIQVYVDAERVPVDDVSLGKYSLNGFSVPAVGVCLRGVSDF